MKKFMLIAMVLFLAAFAFADVIIGTGTSAQYYPMSTYYNYYRSAAIYTAAEINASGTITNLQWYCGTANTSTTFPITIYMKHTTATTLPSDTWANISAGATSVYTGTIAINATGWFNFDITDFVYNGTDNLEILVESGSAAYVSPYVQWRYTTTATNLFTRVQADTTVPTSLTANTNRPNIKLVGITQVATALPNPAVLVFPTSGATVLQSTILSWNPGSTAGGALVDSYDVYFGTTASPAFIGNQTGTTYTPTLAANTTYYWKVVPRNNLGEAAGCPVWSFKTPSPTQVAESFEPTSFPPAGWANPGTWSRSTSYYKDGLASAYKYGSSSSQYILSTPKVTIDATSTLSLWSLCSSTTGTLQIVYSPDRTTWTQIGANITHAVTYTMYNTIVDLSSLAGNNYYLGIRTGLQAASFYIDAVIAPEITPEAPGAPVLSTPATAATNVSEYATLTWTAPTTGGVPTGYRLYVGTDNPPTTLVTNQNVLTYTLTTPLAYNTTYYWTVEAYNTAGTGAQATPFSFTTRANPTITTFPWTVNFGTVAADWPVLNWSQLAGLPGSTLIAGSSWVQDDFGNVVTTPANKAATLNIWSTSTKNWLITPPVAIPAGNYELDFDLAYTTYSGTVAPAAGAQADDKFAVYIADNPNMTGATLLREWNNTGSPYVYDNIPAAGSPQVITLNAYSGTKYIAFYGESTVAGGDNNVYVDNVVVRETPAAPIFTIAPTAWDFPQQIINTTATKQFSITNTGGGTLTVNTINISGTYFTLTTNPAPVSLNAGQTATFTVQYAPTATGNHSATVTINDSRAVTTVNLTGICYDPTISTFPYTVDFSTWMPTTWTQYNYLYGGTPVAGGTSWIQDDWLNVTTPVNKAAKINLYSTHNNWLVTAPINVPAGSYEIKFDMAWMVWNSLSTPVTAGNQSDDRVLLVMSSNPDMSSPTTLMEWNNTGSPNVLDNVPATGATYTVPLTGISGTKFFAFYGESTVDTAGDNDLMVDNFMVRETPVGMPEAVTLTSPADGATGINKEGFSLSWTPAVTGGTPTTYGVWMSMDEGTIYSDFYFETTNTSFNPVTEGAMTFNYEERWYWTIEAINASGSAVVEPAHWFQIEPAPMVISTFPYNENFDAALTLPTDWTVVDRDGAGTSWVGSATYSQTAPNSFKHAYSTAVADPGQNGWLITPAVAVPNGLNMVLSWYNYNAYPTYLVYNGVKVNTTNDPADPNWVELWSAASATQAWSNAVVNISAYGGQTVYFAWNYQGYDADDWYIDSVSIYELTVDTIPPVITHLPHLNTVRDDLSYTISADIADDATWNNPISAATMYYSTDEGATFTPVAMTLGTAPTYTAEIPAQALTTTVQYYITATDSESNTATSDTFSFVVDNPTWVRYHTSGTTYMGYTAYVFGPTVLFANPYYGTGTPVKLLGTEGSSYYATTANLHVYSYDGTTMTDLITPLAINFAAQTYQEIDLSSYNINITTPYFLIAFEDIPAGNYILFDGAYDYGTTYVKLEGSLYTLSNPGSWCIGANITNGVAAVSAPVANIANVAGQVVLSWDAVAGAGSYKIYGADDPYAVDPWTLVGATDVTSYTYTGIEGYKFFKVTADTATLAKSTAKKANLKSRFFNVRATNAPKNTRSLLK